MVVVAGDDGDLDDHVRAVLFCHIRHDPEEHIVLGEHGPVMIDARDGRGAHVGEAGTQGVGHGAGREGGPVLARARELVVDGLAGIDGGVAERRCAGGVGVGDLLQRRVAGAGARGVVCERLRCVDDLVGDGDGHGVVCREGRDRERLAVSGRGA